MHETLCENVVGYIDRINPLKGWCFHRIKGLLPLRLRIGGNVIAIKRPDVVAYFDRHDVTNCGFELDTTITDVLEMCIDGVWETVFIVNACRATTNELPSFVVVDNFYDNPDMIREFALKQTFKEDLRYYKGKRTKSFLLPGLKEKFEKILGVKIDNWSKYGTNAVFQYCIAGDQAVFHCDTQQYAAVAFLTPDAPVETGTRFYRSKNTLKMKVSGNYKTVFPTGHLDSTPFDQVDTVGNVYNRLVLFDAKLIHAAPLYFGDTLENGRLFQIFFFDTDKL